MIIFDYDDVKAIESGCGEIKDGLSDKIGFARANMRKGISGAHYHKKLTEYYLVLEGCGTFRIKTEGGIKDIALKPGVIVRIDPGEIHQTKTPKKLTVEVVTHPAWTESDEFAVDDNLFEE